MEQRNGAITKYAETAETEYRGYLVRTWAQMHEHEPLYYGCASMRPATESTATIRARGAIQVPAFTDANEATTWAGKDARVYIDSVLDGESRQV